MTLPNCTPSRPLETIIYEHICDRIAYFVHSRDEGHQPNQKDAKVI